jgi:hypothetical protein
MVNFPEYESNPVISVDPTLLLPDSRPAGGSDCRDMVVIKNPADGRYYGYFAAMATIAESDTRGVIAVAVSDDLLTWTDLPGLITLGQSEWTWAKGRLTAGAVLDARKIEGVGRYLLFFHGSGPKTESEGDFDRNASVGIAWSDNLTDWHWPER